MRPLKPLRRWGEWDVRCEEFQEAKRGAFAGNGDQRRHDWCPVTVCDKPSLSDGGELVHGLPRFGGLLLWLNSAADFRSLSTSSGVLPSTWVLPTVTRSFRPFRKRSHATTIFATALGTNGASASANAPTG
jgi:hypothetical protein